MSVAWGLLSTARINQSIIEAAAESDLAHVLAVASRDGARAEAYAREHGIERSFGSYEALLDDSDVEAVYISLPNAMHVGWTLRALEAGKHVLCEKPFSRHPERWSRRSTSPTRWPRPLRGIHVAPPPASREARPAGRRRCDRPVANRPRRLQLSARRGSRGRRHALRPRARRGLADGCRLLLPQRDPAARGRARASPGAAGRRAQRRRRLLRGGALSSRRPARALRLRLRASLPRGARGRR